VNLSSGPETNLCDSVYRAATTQATPFRFIATFFLSLSILSLFSLFLHAVVGAIEPQKARGGKYSATSPPLYRS